mgnify:CR=1 FL=1
MAVHVSEGAVTLGVPAGTSDVADNREAAARRTGALTPRVLRRRLMMADAFAVVFGMVLAFAAVRLIEPLTAEGFRRHAVLAAAGLPAFAIGAVASRLHRARANARRLDELANVVKTVTFGVGTMVIVAFLFYWIFGVIRGTRAVQLQNDNQKLAANLMDFNLEGLNLDLDSGHKDPVTVAPGRCNSRARRTGASCSARPRTSARWASTPARCRWRCSTSRRTIWIRWSMTSRGSPTTAERMSAVSGAGSASAKLESGTNRATRPRQAMAWISARAGPSDPPAPVTSHASSGGRAVSNRARRTSAATSITRSRSRPSD